MSNRREVGLSAGVDAADGAPVDLKLAAIEIPPRLRFLEDLQTRPAFEGSEILRRIVDDYRSALARTRGVDMGRVFKP
jgi:hypothetical protein